MATKLVDRLPGDWERARTAADASSEASTPTAPRAARLRSAPAVGRRRSRFRVATDGRGPGRAGAAGVCSTRLDGERIAGHARARLVHGAEPPRPPPRAEAAAHDASRVLGRRARDACRPTGATSRRGRARLVATTSTAARSSSRPINPRRDGGRSRFRFRAPPGTATAPPPAMVRRCLERLDDERHRRPRARAARPLRHAARRSRRGRSGVAGRGGSGAAWMAASQSQLAEPRRAERARRRSARVRPTSRRVRSRSLERSQRQRRRNGLEHHARPRVDAKSRARERARAARARARQLELKRKATSSGPPPASRSSRRPRRLRRRVPASLRRRRHRDCASVVGGAPDRHRRLLLVVAVLLLVAQGLFRARDSVPRAAIRRRSRHGRRSAADARHRVRPSVVTSEIEREREQLARRARGSAPTSARR